MRDVAGMNDEGRLDRHRLYLRDGFAQRAERIRVRGLVKADMTIAHLQEHESSGFCGKRVPDQSHGVRHAPLTPHSTPVPAQTMHSSTSRRPNPCRGSSKPLLAMSHLPVAKRLQMAPLKQET